MVFKRSNWLQLKNPWNLAGDQKERLSTLVRWNAPIIRAHYLKEAFQLFWALGSAWMLGTCSVGGPSGRERDCARQPLLALHTFYARCAIIRVECSKKYIPYPMNLKSAFSERRQTPIWRKSKSTCLTANGGRTNWP